MIRQHCRGGLRSVASLCRLNLATKRRNSDFKQLLKPTEMRTDPGFKISVVGCGQVGAAICAVLLIRNLTKNLVIFDVRKDWVHAEALDFLHGSYFLGNPRITPCFDGSNTKDSDIVIITAGARPSGKERSRLSIISQTAKILQSIVPNLCKLSPKAVFLVVSNPADVMTYVVQKLGKIERHRCFTTGCHLDTARFRYLIAQRLDLPTSCVQGYVIGEHGASAVAVWSSVTVAGVPLSRVVPDLGTEKDAENWDELGKGVRTSAAAVSTVKGYTNWAIALSTADVVQAMQENSGRLLSVGTDMYGINCIDEHVVLSLPCAITKKGISHVLQLPLTDDEQINLMLSADVLLEAQCGLEL